MPPGWYLDQSGRNRWWDGAQWTADVAPPPLLPPPPPSRGMPGWALGLIVGSAVLLLVVAVAAAAIAIVRSASSVTSGRTATATSAPSRTGSPSSGATAGPVPQVTSSTQGTIVYSDDFTSAGSGWTTRKLPSGTTFSYGEGGYVVLAKGDLHHYAFSPFDNLLPQISVSGTFRTDASRPGDSGVGVTCDARAGVNSLFYEFLVVPGGRWFVEEGHGSIGSGSESTILEKGVAPVDAGATTTVTGACATSPDGSSTVLTLFVDGAKLAQVTSTTAFPTSVAGWSSDLVVFSAGTKPTTVVVTDFVLRDLGA